MALNLVNVEVESFTAKADEAISAGDFVKSTSSNDVVTSDGLSSLAADEIKVSKADASGDENLLVGIAADTIASGALGTIYTQGLFIVRSGEAVATGSTIQKAESTDQLEIEVLDAATDGGQNRIGKALTGSSAADKYQVIMLRL